MSGRGRRRAPSERTPPAARNAARLAVGALLILALGVGVWRLLSLGGPLPAPGPSSERARSGPPAPPPRWAGGVLPAGRGSAPAGPKPEGPAVLTEAVPPPDDGPGPHLEHYGGRSGRLAAAGRPGPIEPRAEVASVGKQPELLVWLPSLRVGADGATIHARLRPAPDDRPPALVEIAVAEGTEQTPTRFRGMAPRGPGEVDGPGFAWEFRPGRQPPIAAAGAFTPPPLAIRYLVRARGQLGGEPFERSAGGIFYLHRPGGRLANPPRVERDEGDLVVITQAVIDRPGSYWAHAELWGAGERPVAFARERLPNLPRGKHPVRLLFGGRVIRDSGVDGPYVVRNLRFQQVDTHPPHQAPPRGALPPTPAWKASDFH